MNLSNHLSKKKPAILKRWFDIILKTYPEGTTTFFKDQKKQFANPVGYTLSHELEIIFEGLVNEREMDLERISPALDSVIRIKAVQDLTPSQALAFLFHLKKVIREELRSEGMAASEELMRLDERIDALALLSFDIYMKCREKIFELKANEVKNRTFRLLQMAKLAGGAEEEYPDPK